MAPSSNNPQQPKDNEIIPEALVTLAKYQEKRKAGEQRQIDVDEELARQLSNAFDREGAQKREQRDAADQGTSADEEPKATPDDVDPDEFEFRALIQTYEDALVQSGLKTGRQLQEEHDARRAQEAETSVDQINSDLHEHVRQQLPRSEQCIYVIPKPSEHVLSSGLLQSVPIPALAQPGPNGHLGLHLRTMREVLLGVGSGRARLLRMRGVQYTFTDDRSADILEDPRDAYQSWLGRLRYQDGGPTEATKQKLRQLRHGLHTWYGTLRSQFANRWSQGNGVVGLQHPLWNDVQEAAWEVVGFADALYSAIGDLPDSGELDGHAWRENDPVTREVDEYLRSIMLVAAVTQIEGSTALKFARMGKAEKDEGKPAGDEQRGPAQESLTVGSECVWPNNESEPIGAGAQEDDGQSADDQEEEPAEDDFAAESELGWATSDVEPVDFDTS